MFRETLFTDINELPFSLSNLVIILERGQFGAVYGAVNWNTGQMDCMNRIGLEGLKDDEIAQPMREVDLVKQLSSPSTAV